MTQFVVGENFLKVMNDGVVHVFKKMENVLHIDHHHEKLKWAERLIRRGDESYLKDLNLAGWYLAGEYCISCGIPMEECNCYC